MSGEAGIGKTRLAQHFAHEQRSAYETAGGVWFCDLRDARDAEAMCSTLARTLNIADEATIVGDGAVTAVGRALATRGRALVVLDNLEQLLPDGARVVLRWLDLAREVRFLVTSREPLYLLGEELVELSALSLPDGASPDGDAVRLFVERVRALREAYTPTGDEPAAIRELVLRLRGVPLAIEICASRLGSGDVRSVLGAVEARGATRSIAWSFRRLLPWERETLAQCSVFHGGFTPEAAARVVRLDHDGRTVADVLSVLLHKSLIQTARAEAGARYALCEGIRLAAAELLEQGADAAATRLRHAQYFLDRSSGPLTDFPVTAASARTRDELAADRENLEAVLDLGATSRRADLVIRAAIALDVISAGTGLSRADLARLDTALTTSTSLDPSLTGRALALRAGALRAVGRLAEADRDAFTALGLARAAKNGRQITAMCLAVGAARFQLGDLEWALAHGKAALLQARADGDGQAEPAVLQQIGGVLEAMGELAGARAHYEAALGLALDHDDEVAEARASMGLGSYHLETGRLDRAEHDYDRALLIARRLGMQRAARITMGYLGVTHFDAGRFQEAERWLDRAVDRSRAVGDLRVEGIFEGMRGAVLASVDLVDEARAAFTLSRELLASNSYFGQVIAVHQGHLELAEARAEGDHARAAQLVAAASRRLGVAERGDAEEAPLVRRSDDARIAVRILRRAIEAAAR
ncbi:MAG: tetratricopeptide repeat protein [Byssovorax sp.]